MQRLDVELVSRNLFASREKASQAIKKGIISVDGKIINKPSFQVEESNEILVLEVMLKYVSWGGMKLERAIDYFGLDFNNKTVLDIGASTGGFTDCALQHGAKEVYACCTHAVLSGPAIERINNCPISELLVLDTIPLTPDKTIDKIKVLSVAPVFAEAIKRIYGDISMSELFR